MGHETMMSDFPTQAQRLAVCFAQWRRKDAPEKLMLMPGDQESQTDFMARCVAHPAMMQDYPDEAQRNAVCMTMYQGCDMNMGDKSVDPVIKVRADPPPGNDPLEYVMSDASIDRMGDVIEQSGWDLRNFKSNAIGLFSHKRDFIIGKWHNVRVEKGKLLGRLELLPPVSERLKEIHAAVKAGVLRAVSVGFRSIEEEPLRGSRAGTHFLKQELLECSLVSVPANSNAVAVAKSLGLSDDAMNMIFDRSASMTRSIDTGIWSNGKHAKPARTPAQPGKHAIQSPLSRGIPNMFTLSERIVETQNVLNAKRDKLAELYETDTTDLDAIEELNEQIAIDERALAAFKVSETRIGIEAKAAQPTDPGSYVTGTALVVPGTQGAPVERSITGPAINRKPLGTDYSVPVRASDLLVRSAVCHLCSHIARQPVEKILDERYPGHAATWAVTKADTVIATTTGSGWADALVTTAVADFMGTLPPTAIYPQLRAMGMSLTFGPTAGQIKIPASSTNTGLTGGFVLEGDPIPVGSMTLTSATLLPHKFGIIVPFTKEVLQYTNPTIESVVRDELNTRTIITIDGLLLDAIVGSATRPAGLRYGVSAAGTASGGGDYQAFLTDIDTLLAPFDTANAGRRLALIMNPAQRRKIMMMPGPNNSGFGWAQQFLADFQVISSTSVTSGMLVAIDTADFVTAAGDQPVFETSDQAVIHMSTVPLEIVSGTGPTTADPVRSMFQTNSVALKMTLNLSWAMRRSGLIQWISGATY